MTNQYPPSASLFQFRLLFGTGALYPKETSSEVHHPYLEIGVQHRELPKVQEEDGAPADLQYLIPLFLQVLGPRAVKAKQTEMLKFGPEKGLL